MLSFLVVHTLDEMGRCNFAILGHCINSILHLELKSLARKAQPRKLKLKSESRLSNDFFRFKMVIHLSSYLFVFGSASARFCSGFLLAVFRMRV